MRCEDCDVRRTEHRTTADRPYRYAISGLPNLGLVGVVVHRCPLCEHEQPIIPRLSELHQVVSLVLAKKAAPLTGDEVRFMRKQAGFPQGSFAALLGYSQEHLCRVEKNQKRLSDTAERLARAIIAAVAQQGKDVRAILLSISNKLETKNGQKTAVLPTFKLEADRWKPLVAASGLRPYVARRSIG